jgi:hypothetical protein
MTTERQKEANRRNARKSTGPRTAAGKARSSTNALKHGLTSRTVVLADESGEKYEELRRNLYEELDPGSQLESLLVNRLVAVQWRLARVPALEAQLLGRLREGPTGGDEGLGAAWAVDAGPYGGALARLVRYEVALERSATRLLTDLRRLRRERLAEERDGMAEAHARAVQREWEREGSRLPDGPARAGAARAGAAAAGLLPAAPPAPVPGNGRWPAEEYSGADSGAARHPALSWPDTPALPPGA